ncbi:WYL domain-containing protein [Nakamurella sp. YIM 132087]|uniref:WYL domain-containing protein n=1 Tax=Nakamurella alba TaxID=2665158 RepID=A0A7K1FUH6_9ACTN|nr:WYL domain-containing protein [Nakamurella alba]MTD16999.1 WYL domain-containing protein [Nakamurella alba]
MPADLPPIAFSLAEVEAITAALATVPTTADGRDPAVLGALRKLAGAVVSADEEPRRPAVTRPAATPSAASRPAAPPARQPEVLPGNVVRLFGGKPAPAPERQQVDEDVLEALEEAIAVRRVVTFLHTDGRGRTTERIVEPSGILTASGRRYLLGWCRTREDGRHFRLDRIAEVEITDEPAPDRDMAAVLGPLGRGEPVPAPRLVP